VTGAETVDVSSRYLRVTVELVDPVTDPEGT